MANTEKTWQGYTIDEIRVRRMVNLAKIEIEKSRLKMTSQPIADKVGFFKGSSPIFKKITGALDYADYAFLAFSIFRRVRKMFKKK